MQIDQPKTRTPETQVIVGINGDIFPQGTVEAVEVLELQIKSTEELVAQRLAQLEIAQKTLRQQEKELQAARKQELQAIIEEEQLQREERIPEIQNMRSLFGGKYSARREVAKKVIQKSYFLAEMPISQANETSNSVEPIFESEGPGVVLLTNANPTAAKTKNDYELIFFINSPAPRNDVQVKLHPGPYGRVGDFSTSLDFSPPNKVIYVANKEDMDWSETTVQSKTIKLIRDAKPVLDTVSDETKIEGIDDEKATLVIGYEAVVAYLLSHPEFKDKDSTAQLIEVIDRHFDIPLGENDRADVLKQAQDHAIRYIVHDYCVGLDRWGNKVRLSDKKKGKTIYNLPPEIIKNNPKTYVEEVVFKAIDRIIEGDFPDEILEGVEKVDDFKQKAIDSLWDRLSKADATPRYSFSRRRWLSSKQKTNKFKSLIGRISKNSSGVDAGILIAEDLDFEEFAGLYLDKLNSARTKIEKT